MREAGGAADGDGAGDGLGLAAGTAEPTQGPVTPQIMTSAGAGQVAWLAAPMLMILPPADNDVKAYESAALL